MRMRYTLKDRIYKSPNNYAIAQEHGGNEKLRAEWTKLCESEGMSKDLSEISDYFYDL
jgi:hypothetical protein